MHWTAPAFGLGAFAAAAIAFAPATLVDARLERASDGRIRLAQAQGSLWSGAGWLEVRDAQGRSAIAKRIVWRVLPESLLRARLLARVELEEDARPFAVTLSLSRVEITGAGVDLPAAALGLGMPGLAALRLSGELRLEIPRLSLEHGRMDGDATLRWRAAGSALTPVSPLGEYEVRFKALGSVMQADLRTLEGPLELAGNGKWINGEAPSFLATARVPAQHHEQLTPLFRAIAVERAAGTFELRLR